MYKRFILVATLMFAIVAISIGDEIIKNNKPQEQQYKDIASQVKLFGEVYREVGRRYVDELDVKEFMRAGIDGMLSELDPYTVFFDPDEQESIEMLTKGEFGGVGIEIGLRGENKELTVIAPMSDTPADRKGLRSGDVITAVDGKSTAGFSTSDAAKHIKGPAGTEVTLTIRRPGHEGTLDYTLERENIQIHDIAYSGMISEDIGYIKLTRFSKNAGDDLQEALRELKKNNPKGLILDLRSNPGGLLPAAVKVSQQFLQKNDLIVSTRGRIKQSNTEFRTRQAPIAGDIPLVVLINGGSASASEIVTGAIQDLDRGIVIGTPSFGKGLVQTVINLNDGNAVKITTARYYTPSGRLIQKDRKREKDYDENGLLKQIEKLPDPEEVDSTAERFLTRAGREVFGGGGITPDLLIKPKLMNQASVELFRQDLFFNFIDKWLSEKGRPDTVIVSDEMLTLFDDFLKEKKFEYSIKGMNELNTLRKLGETDSLNEDYFKLLDNIEAKLAAPDKDAEAKVDDFIYQNLDRQLASALGGREWRIISTFDEDTVLTVAIDLLHDLDRYNSMLQPHTSSVADD